jgi:hypothetical protein
VWIKFCANLGESVTENLAKIRQAFREDGMSRTRAFEWHAQFRASRTSVEDNQRRGRPISSTTAFTVARLQRLVHEDRRQTMQDLADEIEIGYETWQRILTAELGMHHVTAKFMPRILT